MEYPKAKQTHNTKTMHHESESRLGQRIPFVNRPLLDIFFIFYTKCQTVKLEKRPRPAHLVLFIILHDESIRNLLARLNFSVVAYC